MRLPSWQVESAIRRMNRGKPSAAQLANEEARTILRENISTLQTQWANEDVAEQARRTADTQKVMNDTEQNKLRQLVARDIRRNRFGDWGKVADALAAVTKQHPEFCNIKDAVLTEFVNESASLPPSKALKAEVAVMQRASGLTYDEAFRAVMVRYPALVRRTTLANDDLAAEITESRDAGVEFQKQIDAYSLAHPGADRRKQADYNLAFAVVSRSITRALSNALASFSGCPLATPHHPGHH